LQIDQRISGNLIDPDQLIQFQLHRLRIAALGVLNHENHLKGDNGRPSVDDQLPSIRPAEDWARSRPETLSATTSETRSPAP
jgi:hypothetical protein